MELQVRPAWRFSHCSCQKDTPLLRIDLGRFRGMQMSIKSYHIFCHGTDDGLRMKSSHRIAGT